MRNGNLPALQLVRLPHDHFGDFQEAIDGVNTPDTQMADNDYAVGLLVEKVAKSPYKDTTLIFVIEDDAQNGADHVDAHRSLAHIVGPYVKQGAVVSTSYTTVSLLRTIEDILGLEPLGLTDGLAEPMAEVFEQTLRPWTYTALVPEAAARAHQRNHVAVVSAPIKENRCIEAETGVVARGLHPKGNRSPRHAVMPFTGKR